MRFKVPPKLLAPAIAVVALFGLIAVGPDSVKERLIPRSLLGPLGAEAQGTRPALVEERATNAAVTADDTDVAMRIQYIGSAASGLVAIADATGDLTFTDGALAAEVATDTFECPVSGGLGGIIDVSDAACNTMDEVVDIINASSDWRAVLIDSLGTDSSDNRMQTLAATQAKIGQVTGGVAGFIETDTAFLSTRALLPAEMRLIEFYYEDSAGSRFRSNPFQGYEGQVSYMNATSTYASGTSFLDMFSVIPVLGAASSYTEAREFRVAGGATTVNKVITDFIYTPLLFPRGAKPIVRITNSAAGSAVQLIAGGRLKKYE